MGNILNYRKPRSKNGTAKMLIYIVEDDLNIREIQSYALKNSGFEVKGFENSSQLYTALKEKKPQLIILDIMLPKENGMSILKTLKKNPEYNDMPIIFVTAKDSEMDKVKGLDSGADDYITKPFGVMELISRVKAALRHGRTSENDDVLTYGHIQMDNQRHKVTTGGEECQLTHKEYELLKYMLLNPNIVLSRDKIMRAVWGYDYEGETRTVDAHIKTLRQKLKDSSEYIKTVRNIGYKLGE